MISKKNSDWAKFWKIKFNEEKTEIVNIKRDTKPIHQLTFGNVVLEEKPHHKHLGITLKKTASGTSTLVTFQVMLACSLTACAISNTN